MEGTLEDFQAHLADSADWKLVFTEGKDKGSYLLCHSLLLRLSSPVFAAAPRNSDESAIINFPSYVGTDTATIFLRWLYRSQFVLSANTAYRLALLSHEWDITGTSTPYLGIQTPFSCAAAAAFSRFHIPLLCKTVTLIVQLQSASLAPLTRDFC